MGSIFKRSGQLFEDQDQNFYFHGVPSIDRTFTFRELYMGAFLDKGVTSKYQPPSFFNQKPRSISRFCSSFLLFIDHFFFFTQALSSSSFLKIRHTFINQNQLPLFINPTPFKNTPPTPLPLNPITPL